MFNAATLCQLDEPLRSCKVRTQYLFQTSVIPVSKIFSFLSSPCKHTDIHHPISHSNYTQVQTTEIPTKTYRTPRSRSTLPLVHAPHKDGSIAHRWRQVHQCHSKPSSWLTGHKPPTVQLMKVRPPFSNMGRGLILASFGFYFSCFAALLRVYHMSSFSLPSPQVPPQVSNAHVPCIPPPPGYQLALPGAGDGKDGAASRSSSPLKPCWLKPPPSLQPAVEMK